MANFFDASDKRREQADDLMYDALNEMSMANLQGDTRVFRQNFMETVNRLLQSERMTARMGARASQARFSRLVRPGSGQNIGEGWIAGAGWGQVANLEYQAMRDAVELAFRRRGGRSQTFMQGAQNRVAATQNAKSGWDITKDAVGTAGEWVGAFSGNPFSFGDPAVQGAPPLSTTPQTAGTQSLGPLGVI